MLHQPQLIAVFVVAITLCATVNCAVLANRAVSHWGTGCPQSASNFRVSVNGNTITAHFDALAVRSGANVDQSDKEEFCAFSVEIGCAARTQFSIASTSYHDSLDVASGFTASHLMRYNFQGGKSTFLEMSNMLTEIAVDSSDTRRNFAGPVSGGFDETDVVSSGDRVWSDCGSTSILLVTNRGVITGNGGGSAKTSYFSDGDVTTTLEWRAC